MFQLSGGEIFKGIDYFWAVIVFLGCLLLSKDVGLGKSYMMLLWSVLMLKLYKGILIVLAEWAELKFKKDKP
jgi:hypothetical protein